MSAPPSDRKQPASAALVIFAKAPIPGQVKTRLCPGLTEDEAATLHGSFVLDTLERTKAAVHKFKLPVDRFLACAPSSTHVFFRIMEARHGVTLLDQPGDNLGDRMAQAFSTLFARGYRHVFLVGTDVPSLPLTHYRDAVQSLTRHDLILGPAKDGGYYLIGMTAPHPDLFSDIPWSTDQVMGLTQQKAAAAGLKTALLPAWSDVDTLDDLHALIDDCAADKKRPKQERVYSQRTAGTLELLAKRLRTRHT
ncbi:MAG TPA: TIGR04282 family arsenosugar biosynthesis glycosyltransferase [Nitrospira sp.]|mgnify:FL=1|nr:TIGR04282 family arsenosugar biosynthesis glycosyltransferase [Nitrospira sp.]HRB82650.1 TIGR04282 family arsenosugar biosynthesis glycosyltransferase [Nitrospira sp.]